MEKQFQWKKLLLRSISYILVAAVASAITLALCVPRQEGPSKLDELEALIHERFIGEADQAAMEDGAAAGMVNALGDEWSYYLPVSQVQARMDQVSNTYIGIGVTIMNREDGLGFDVLQVEPDGSAKVAGVLPGDVITAVEGQPAAELGVLGAQEIIRGEENTDVTITILRDGQSMDITITRKRVQVKVATGQLLEGNIGLVKITNFDDRCCDETVAVIEELLEQGATSLIFDVRNNPGGYKHEMVELLDYLLPEGVLFRSLYYNGQESVDESDARCLPLPMAVLVNADSYSASEFFAAALSEYGWAVTVGEATYGKGYFQEYFELSDGSGVGLSVGKYFTPNGVSLAEAGGLVPEIPVDVDDETDARIYAGLVDAMDDPQILAAIDALK